jgi:hypothetical protein
MIISTLCSYIYWIIQDCATEVPQKCRVVLVIVDEFTDEPRNNHNGGKRRLEAPSHTGSETRRRLEWAPLILYRKLSESLELSRDVDLFLLL